MLGAEVISNKLCRRSANTPSNPPISKVARIGPSEALNEMAIRSLFGTSSGSSLAGLHAPEKRRGEIGA